jgi:choline dehydrogenase-like flavoprotein
MLIDAATPDRAAFARRFDVCVIGSGPAGITLARALAAQGYQVALMEGGGFEPTDASTDVYVGENTGLPYHDLEITRLRYFGGSSGHWEGLCRELDAGDFAPHPQEPLSGWPIAKADLDPYEPAAAEILELGPPFPAEVPPLPVEGFREIQFRRSPPTRFGDKYRDEITASPNIWLGLNANLVDLRLDAGTDGGLGTVAGALFRSFAPDDPGFTVTARRYCLCTGGIENARLLLNFDSQAPGGIGNGNGLVGRYFCEHPAFFLGEVLFEHPGVAMDDSFITTTEAFRAAEATLGLSIRLHRRPRRHMSFLTEAARSAECNLPFVATLAKEVLGQKPVRCDLGGLMEYRRSLTPDDYPWALATTNAAQALNPESRVELAEARDALGLRRTRLHWEVLPIDYHSIKATTLALGQSLAEQGIARIRLYDWLAAENPVMPKLASNMGEIGSYHHMCTTRMSDDPRTGVVDRDCRVHGTGNLYIGGSSVFATSGYVNPTYTIVQLALRLGDHLGQELHT